MSFPQLVTICLVRERWLWISVFVAGLAAAAMVTFALPKVYEATATIAVDQNRGVVVGEDVLEADEALARTYAEVLQTPTTTDAVLRALPFRTTRKELEDKVAFEAVTATRLLRIDAEDREPRRAQAIANTYARVLVRQEKDELGREANEAIARLRGRLESLTSRISSLERQSGSQAEARRRVAQSELEATLAAYRSFQESSARPRTVSIASNAVLPTSPVRPRPKLYLALGAFFSLVLAVAAALLRHTFDKRVHEEAELVSLMEAPVLSRIPFEKSDSHETVEAFQFLRSNIQLADPRRAMQLIVVVSAELEDGKSTVVKNLARAMAASGAAVIAVDCDLRRPQLHRLFEVKGRHGLVDVLSGGSGAAELLQETGEPNLRVLPAGRPATNPPVLLTLPRFWETLQQMREHANYILLDTPPITTGADASAVAAIADGAIFVVDAEEARRDVLAAAREQLEKSGVNLLGLVLNRVRKGAMPYGYGYPDESRRRWAPASEPAQAQQRPS